MAVNIEEIKKINALVPIRGKIVKIVEETADVRTFHVTSFDGTKPFEPLPGQLAMFSLPHVGEAMFSITDHGENHLELAIKKVGILTDELHDIEEGQECGIRGPYGNGFPLDYLKGKDVLIIGGGIGLAPVRSFVQHAIRNREDFGKLTVVYGARSSQDLVFKEDLFENWPKVENMDVHVTVDRGDDSWTGNVGFVPAFLESLAPKPQVTILCGPPIMIKFCLQSLSKMNFADPDIITTLELRMKCGIGKCGRCNIGSCYVCLDGPVFTLEQLKEMPPEY